MRKYIYIYLNTTVLDLDGWRKRYESKFIWSPNKHANDLKKMINIIYNHNRKNKYDKIFFFKISTWSLGRKWEQSEKLMNNDGNDSKKINGQI